MRDRTASGRRRWLPAVIAVAVALAAGFGAVRRDAAAAPDAAPVLLVGDSVMNGMAQGYGAPARQLLAERHAFLLDTAGCRRLITTSCSIGGRPAPTNALTVVRSRSGQYARALVVAAGYNDPTTGSVGIDTAVDVLVEEARAQGIEHVVWLTYREAGSQAPRFRAHNAVLWAKAGSHPELTIADWAAVSASMPPSWFSADGIHLGASAASGMAALIADTLDVVLAADEDEAAAITTTTWCRLVDTTSAVVAPAPAAGAPTEIVDGAVASQLGRRLHLWCP